MAYIQFSHYQFGLAMRIRNAKECLLYKSLHVSRMNSCYLRIPLASSCECNLHSVSSLSHFRRGTNDSRVFKQSVV